MQEPVEWQYIWWKMIAHAWGHPEFKEALINPAEGVTVADVVKEHLNLTLEGPDWVKLVIKDPAKEDPGACQWVPNMQFWTLPYTEAKLGVPKRPDKDEDISEKLVDFIWKLEKVRMRLSPPKPKGGEPDVVQGAESPLPAIETMIRWFIVWPRAVALAWSSPEFARQLEKEPHVALYNAFGFQVPGGLKVSVTLNAELVGKDQMPEAQLVMMLPPAPPNMADRAIALGAYIESGRSYPFTLFCC